MRLVGPIEILTIFLPCNFLRFAFACSTSSPQLDMKTATSGLFFLSVSRFSICLTMSWPAITSPNTTCLLKKKLVAYSHDIILKTIASLYSHVIVIFTIYLYSLLSNFKPLKYTFKCLPLKYTKHIMIQNASISLQK